MKRRDFLASSLVVAASQAIDRMPAWAQAKPPVLRVKRMIDAHCHVFNARDLPMEGFAKKVVIRDNHELSKQFHSFPRAFIVLIHAMASMMQDEAPAVADEIRLIDRIDKGLAQAPDLAARQIRDIANLTKVLKKIWSRDILRELPLDQGFAAEVGVAELQRMLLEEVYPDMFCCVAGEEEIDELIQSANLDTLAEQLYADGNQKTIGRNIRWAMLFTRYRFELVDQLSNLHSKRATLMTPAIIDFSKWVNDDSHTTIREQVEAMERISLRRKGPRVHGFVGCDPLRQVIFEHDPASAPEEPFGVVKAAIEQHGFIGIKLYPPMGFRPIGNDELGDQFPSHVKRILGPQPGPILDECLLRLYGWCAANNVPIMAHAANSNGAGPGYGMRANPQYWARVLARFPNLRINMAHFGGFAQLGTPPRREAAWEWEIGNIIRKAPGGYAYGDLSYFSEVLSTESDRKALLALLAAFRKEFANSADHLIYGTDWLMVGREQGFHARSTRGFYADLLADFLQEAGYTDDAIDKIMFRNAVRFLGLGPDERASGTRGRLEKFYVAHKMSTDWMRAFG